MAPPRFQCLNTARQIARQAPSLRAAFSKSRVAPAAEPQRPRPSATSDLLSAGNGPPSPPNKYRYSGPEAVFTNPIQQQQPIGSASTHQGLQRLIERSKIRGARLAANPTHTTSMDLATRNRSAGLSKQITRRFRPGDVYAPHDLSEVEMAKWKKRDKPQHDVFDVLDFNPLDNYRNFSVMSEYMTPMGRITSSKQTGLRPVNQRRIAKAIRRSIGMGLMPSVHRHPELFYQNKQQRSQLLTPTRSDVPAIY